LAVLGFDWFAFAAMTALARHMRAAAHPMLPLLWHFSADWQSDRKNRQSND